VVRFRTWRQKNKRLVLITGVVFTVVLIAFTLLVYIFGWNWTGFNGGYSKITTTITTHGAITTTEQLPTKTLWDWLQLLAALAIPVVVGFGAAWFTIKQTQAQTQASEAANKQRHETELQITADNQREAALQSYIDKLSELLLHEHLSEFLLFNHLDESPNGTQIVIIARARTATVLRILDPVRRGSLIRFLSQAGILTKCIEDELVGIDLSRANLTKVNLDKINLEKANLQGANLREASLQETNLTGTNLQGALLWEANLQGARLDRANLQGDRLVRADLQRAVLWGTNLENSNLFLANLSRANLSGAYLTGAILEGANLKGVTGVTVEELEKKAKSLKGAIMPDGIKHD